MNPPKPTTTNKTPEAPVINLETEDHTPTSPQPPKKLKKIHRKHKIIFGVISVVVVASIITVLAFLLWFGMALTAVRPDVPVNGVVVVIEPNSSLEKIADQLSAKDLIAQKNVFVLYAKFGPARGKLQPGPYLIKPSNSIQQIVSDMAAGKTAISKITYPEGITINDMAKRFAAAGYGSKDEYLAATKRLAPEFGFIPLSSHDNPEGYVFPATYTFTVNSPAEVLVRKQYEAFRTNALPVLQGKRPAGLSENDVLTLASIVEKEALTDKDRKLVAGVFLNRIAAGMKFESDVTVNYATGKTQTSASDISINSPYNTYRVKGLPPTPINNPSTDAIEAVMNPTPSDYIFFLAGDDGTVYYAKTLSEHNENIKNHL